MRVAIAADLGGTLLRTGLVTPDHHVMHESRHRIEDRRGNDAVAGLLCAALRQVRAYARDASVEPIAVGLAVPGLVDRAKGILRYSGNLEVRDLPIAAAAHEAIALPVVVENDVRAAAWGEWTWGAGRGIRHMVYLNAGTGIAAGVISDGCLYRGATAAAGELGHTPMIPDGEMCRCGQRGCLETVAGGWGIERRAEMPTAEAVFEAAARGDGAARVVIEDAGRFLGLAAVTVVRLWNPERLVLGGGLFYDGSPLIGAVREAIARSPLYGEVPPSLSLAEFGGSAGLMGAACLALAT